MLNRIESKKIDSFRKIESKYFFLNRNALVQTNTLHISPTNDDGYKINSRNVLVHLITFIQQYVEKYTLCSKMLFIDYTKINPLE